MNSCRLKSAWALAGTAVAAGFITAHAQQAFPGGGRKIEFSDPGGSVVSSNLNAMMKGKAAFPSLGDELRMPAEVFQPGSSLQGIGGPMIQRAPSSAVNNKKLKELLEKRRDWQFLEMEDYQSEQTIEQMLGITEYGASGELKEEKSPLQRYYERFDRANASATNRTRDDSEFDMELGFGRRDRGKEPNFLGKEREPREIADAEDPMKQMLRGTSANPLFPDKTRPTGFSGMFGQSESWKTETSETRRAQDARLEEFRRMLDSQALPSLPSSSVSGVLPFDPFKPVNSSTPTLGLPRAPDSTPVVSTAPFAPGRDSLSPIPTAGGLAARPLEPPVGATGNPNLSPSTPLPEPTRTVAPATDFNIPKRRFN